MGSIIGLPPGGKVHLTNFTGTVTAGVDTYVAPRRTGKTSRMLAYVQSYVESVPGIDIAVVALNSRHAGDLLRRVNEATARRLGVKRAWADTIKFANGSTVRFVSVHDKHWWRGLREGLFTFDHVVDEINPFEAEDRRQELSWALWREISCI